MEAPRKRNGDIFVILYGGLSSAGDVEDMDDETSDDSWFSSMKNENEISQNMSQNNTSLEFSNGELELLRHHWNSSGRSRRV